MTRDFLMATIAALGLTGCGPDLSTETKPTSSLGAAPAQPAEAGKPVGEPTVAQTQRQDDAQPAAGGSKEDEKKEDGEKKPQ